MCAKLLQLGPAFCDAMDCSPPGSSVEFSRQEYWSKQFAIFSSRGSSQPRDRTCVLWGSCIAGRFSTIGPSGKPKNTGVGSHSLLQGVFWTQGLNPGLPHCREILYRLSHQGTKILSYHVDFGLDQVNLTVQKI